MKYHHKYQHKECYKTLILEIRFEESRKINNICKPLAATFRYNLL